MLVKFNNQTQFYKPGSIGIVLAQANTGMPLMRGVLESKVTSNLICQDLWEHQYAFQRIPHNKVNLRKFAKQLKGVQRATANCKPFSL